MVKITEKDGKQFANIDELFRWEKNPKIVLREDFDRLKKHIQKFGQFKPIIITPDGEVIGGNSRLEALRDLGIKEIWVSVVEPKDEAEKIEIALADNDEVGKYVEEDLAMLITDLDEPFPMEDYKVNVGKDIDLNELLKKLGPTDDKDIEGEKDEDLDDLQTITCPKCGHEFTVLKEKKGK
jgi:hypothetical protein